MDTALTAFIVVLVVIFAVATFAQATIQSQDDLLSAQLDVSERVMLQNNTALQLVSADVKADGTTLQVLIRNIGNTRFSDYSDWDVIVNYDGVSSIYHTYWVPYNESGMGVNIWSVDGIFLDAERNIPEMSDPHILNTSEIMVVEVQLSEALATDKVLQASITTPIGIGTTAYATRNSAPTLTVNEQLIIPQGETGIIDLNLLRVDDINHSYDDITYQIQNTPTDGELTPVGDFTQTDVNSGVVQYTHTGVTHGTDSFTFWATDGVDTIGTYTFNIKMSAEPILTTNNGLSINVGDTTAITSAALAASDFDNGASDLVYTVTTSPNNGYLSMSTFTQTDINNGLVVYYHTGAGNDSFAFTLADDVNQIGAFLFEIVVS